MLLILGPNEKIVNIDTCKFGTNCNKLTIGLQVNLESNYQRYMINTKLLY